VSSAARGDSTCARAYKLICDVLEIVVIDTHCHLTSSTYGARAADIIRDAHGAGVDRMVTVATSPTDSAACVEAAKTHPGVFASVGVHPGEAARWQDQQHVTTSLRALIDEPEVVALGEMGLDLHYDDPPLDLQRPVLDWQLELAAEVPHLPIIIHNREATDQTLEALRAAGLPGERFVFHCFTGDRSELDAILAFGAMVSFTGIVTFSNARDLAEAAMAVPLDRLMVETDAPYLTPEPHRKVRPNEPKYVPHVAAFLAEQFGMDRAEFIAQCDHNAERFFNLPDVAAGAST